jgi:hypothetical protein
LGFRHVYKTCAFHEALQAEKHKEVHLPYSPYLSPAFARSGEYGEIIHRFLKRPLLTVFRRFMNVSNSVFWSMAIILKTNKFNFFVPSVIFVF